MEHCSLQLTEIFLIGPNAQCHVIQSKVRLVKNDKVKERGL